ncbi:MAG TPA: zinc ribbon domain-containing protein [Abditibacterium sp.]|jgi:hypothetical protein
MAYQTKLPSGENLIIENQGDQTRLTFASGTSSQRQSQRSGFSSGAWTQPPTLFQLRGGLILRIEAEKSHYLHLEGHGMRHLETAPDLRNAELLPLQRAESTETDSHPIPPMKPLEPMKPMAPMKPMEMRLGSMHMSMGNASETAPPIPPAPPSKNDSTRAAFCTQCGQRAEEADRFCARCGHELRAL